MTPQISVLIPVYNAEKNLPKCLESVLKQTFENFEIVCVDDGSSDRSGALLKAFASRDGRVRVIAQHNAGVGAARNRLLEEARGKYICFLDADDWLYPRALQVLHTRAEAAGADITRALFEAYDERDGRLIPCDKRYRDYARKKREPVTWPERFEAGQDDSQVWGKLIKTDLVRRHKIKFMHVRYAEDVSFEILLYLHASSIAFVNRYLQAYRTGAGASLSADKSAMARGIALNWCYLSEELARRGFDLPELYGALLRLMVKSVRRFRRLKLQEEDVFLLQKVCALIDKHRARCYAWARWRYGLFVRLARGKTPGRMIFWACLLR